MAIRVVKQGAQEFARDRISGYLQQDLFYRKSDTQEINEDWQGQNPRKIRTDYCNSISCKCANCGSCVVINGFWAGFKACLKELEKK